MEEQVRAGLAAVLQDVAAAQRQVLARANTLARLRMMPPTPRSPAQRLVSRVPRLRFVLPTLAAVGAGVFWWNARPMPLTFAIGDTITGDGHAGIPSGAVGARLQAPADRRLPVAFSDGSSIALDRGARARVTALDERGATVRLDAGRAEISVHHRRNTRWSLQAGPFEVAVTGTRFSLDWSDDSGAITVVMSEGTVEVRGQKMAGGGPVVVTAGQRFHATARESRWTLAASSEPELATLSRTGVPAGQGGVVKVAADPISGDGDEELAGAPPGESPPAATAAGTRVATGSAKSWQNLARSGRYKEALHAAERRGFDRACRTLGAEDLVQLGDVARLARSAARAEQAYRVARRRFPSSDRPAFALGLVAFEQRRDYRTAGRWFDTYVSQYPKGPLAREALGREMESWHRGGETARARAAARSYLSQAPTGPYAPLARQIVSP